MSLEILFSINLRVGFLHLLQKVDLKLEMDDLSTTLAADGLTTKSSTLAQM